MPLVSYVALEAFKALATHSEIAVMLEAFTPRRDCLELYKQGAKTKIAIRQNGFGKLLFLIWHLLPAILKSAYFLRRFMSPKK